MISFTKSYNLMPGDIELPDAYFELNQIQIVFENDPPKVVAKFDIYRDKNSVDAGRIKEITYLYTAQEFKKLVKSISGKTKLIGQLSAMVLEDEEL